MTSAKDLKIRLAYRLLPWDAKPTPIERFGRARSLADAAPLAR